MSALRPDSEWGRWARSIYFGLLERQRPEAVAGPHDIGHVDDSALDMLWTQTRDDLMFIRESQRSLQTSIVAIFTGALLAISFLTPVVIERELWGGPYVPWILGPLAVLLSIYLGSLCGLLLIRPAFRTSLQFDPAAIDSPVDAKRELIEATRYEVYRSKEVLSLSQAGFGRMVHMTWFALLCWVGLGVAAAVG